MFGVRLVQRSQQVGGKPVADVFGKAFPKPTMGSRGGGKEAIIGLVAINAAVCGVWQFADRGLKERMTDHMVASPRNWEEGRWWSVLTAPFSHLEVLPCAVNMFVLYVPRPCAVLVLCSHPTHLSAMHSITSLR
jgi:hypothetical protein